MKVEEDKSVSLKKVADVLWQCTSPHIPLPSSRAPCYWGGQGKEVLSFDLQLHARSFLGMMQSSPLEIKIYSKMVSHF